MLKMISVEFVRKGGSAQRAEPWKRITLWTMFRKANIAN